MTPTPMEMVQGGLLLAGIAAVMVWGIAYVLHYFVALRAEARKTRTVRLRPDAVEVSRYEWRLRS